jgi:hypothetical protein
MRSTPGTNRCPHCSQEQDFEQGRELIAQLDTIKQRLDRAADDVKSPPPVEVQADVSCREFEALLPGNEESGRGVPGSTSVLDVIDNVRSVT